MNVLLVYPKFPVSFWGMQYAMPVCGTRAVLPPLGLVTLAGQLPRSWQLRLIDLNIEDLGDGDVRWADAVFVGGMRVQADSMHEVLARCRALGRTSVVGGPAPTASPEEYGDADVIFRGESEGRIDALGAALAAALPAAGATTAPAARAPLVVAPPADEARPAIADAPLPRFDLLDLRAYASAAIQYSRGCPFHCEFCDIVELFGHRPRLKTRAQVLAELEALYGLGWRGSLFIVDDNFIGNRVAVKRTLPAIARWQQERGYPFDLFTEASVDLAADPELIAAMVTAGFSSVFVGIETPSTKALAGAGKQQNTRVDLAAAVRTLTAAGIEVMGGFIVGFDEDDDSVFAAQRRFIDGLPLPLAMVGMLSAFPNTALWRRLEREGRLRGNCVGDNLAQPNFEPAMDERALLAGYAELLAALYDPAAYYRRCRAFLEGSPPRPGGKRVEPQRYRSLARAVLRIGVLSPRRWHFWRLLWHAARRAPHNFGWSVARAAQGEHMVRYTSEHVFPRLAATLRALDERRAGVGAGSRTAAA